MTVRSYSKTYKVPKRPYEAARLDAELKVGRSSAIHAAVGELGDGRELA